MNPTTRVSIIGIVLAMMLTLTAAQGSDHWRPGEIEVIKSLSLGDLGPVPEDASNRFAEVPSAVELGHKLFFDKRLSANGQVSCATCHLPNREFQDGTPQAKGVGTTTRRTMPVTATAHSRFLFWDGRKDSQWAQALGPLESKVEHGGDRTQYAHVIREHYRNEYEAIFGALPELSSLPSNAGPVADPTAAANWRALSVSEQEAVTQVFVNIGKAIAAYERRIQYGPSRFDIFIQSLIGTDRDVRPVLSPDEKAGLRLFIGKANCLQCHNGPLFSNQEFHNTGVPAVAALPRDRGRIDGAAAVLADEFNCRSRWSDADPQSCRELDYMVKDGHELEGAYKVPSLRNVAGRAPYMHAGQLLSLEDVVAHYNEAPAAPVGRTELKPLKLSKREIAQLVSFLRTLNGGIDAPPGMLSDPF